MSIEDDVALLARVPVLNLLGMAALQVLAIGAEQRTYNVGDKLFRIGDMADGGFVVRRGSFKVSGDSLKHETIAGPGTLIGELTLLIEMPRSATATALEYSSVVRLSRTLYQRVLESHPDAARRVRDDLAARTNEAASSIARVTTKLI